MDRLIDIAAPRFTFDAKARLHKAGFMSQSHRMFASTRVDIISVYMSKVTEGHPRNIDATGFDVESLVHQHTKVKTN